MISGVVLLKGSKGGLKILIDAGQPMHQEDQKEPNAPL
jgi:hypothetical protein